MKYRELAKTGTKLSSIGLGCMGMSFAYGEPDNVESIATLRNSLELGINFWDTADIYGNGANEELLSQVLKDDRDKVFLATKFGFRQGEKDMYLLHHEEIESLAKNLPEVQRIRFFMTFGQSYLTHLKCLENVGMTSIEPIIYEGKEISLAPREFEVLYLLAQRPNWVIPKKNIYCSVWESNYYDDQIPYKTVEHVVWKIRKKMGHDIIETLINVGYRLKKM